MLESILTLYESLKGTRVKDGELFIKDFEHEDYEELYFYLLDELKPYFKNDYYKWYDKTLHQYVRFRKKTTRNNETYVPQENKVLEDQSIQEQLAVIKFFIYRQATNKYKRSV